MVDLRLFTYKQTHDTGFAPNPFHGRLTLATCKPKIRECKRIDDWVAGFTSTALNGDAVGQERLIYLMQIGEKVPLELYHSDPRFADKIPSDPADAFAPCIRSVGDNIYAFRDGAFVQLPNRSHVAKDVAKDTGGKFALVARIFYYFGSEPLVIPDEIRPRVPVFQAASGIGTKDPVRAQAFIDFVTARGPGIHDRPTSWKTGDESWRQTP